MSNDKKKKKTSPYGAKRPSVSAKPKKTVNPATVDKVKTGFMTLISNNAVVKAGRNYGWIAPLILALLAAIIALIPSFVSGMTANAGVSFMATNSYGIENGLTLFTEDLNDEAATMKFTISDKKINVEGFKNEILTYDISDVGDSETHPTSRHAFEVFYNDPAAAISNNDFVARILKNQNPYTNTPRADKIDANSDEIYRTNFVVFSETSITFGKFPRNAKSNGSRITVLYDGEADGFNFKDLGVLPEGVEKGTIEATNAVRANWQEFIRKGYESTKLGNTWSTTGIMFGVNVGVILLFGFVIWLMTRGKFNPFRTVKVIEGFKMAGWAAMAPAILSMLGFLLQAYASFIFIFLFGIRVMWMSMRALRPYETAGTK